MSIQNSNYAVLIPITESGGYGDVIAGKALSEEFRLKNIRHYLDFPDKSAAFDSFRYLAHDSYVFEDCDLRSYKVISVCPVYDERKIWQKMSSHASILVDEFDSSASIYSVSDLLDDSYSSFKNNPSSFIIKTGLSDGNIFNEVNSGVYVRDSLEKKLELSDKYNDDNNLGELKKIVLDDIIKNYDLTNKNLGNFYKNYLELFDSNWSIAYPSTLKNRREFFKIADFAKNNLNKNLVIFSVCSEKFNQNDIMLECISKGINHYNLSAPSFYETGSKITVIELGKIPETGFMDLLSVVDSLSLVTGDHSLSQMLQKSQHKTAVPFFYHKAGWKEKLAIGMYNYISMTDKISADLFLGYINNSIPFKAINSSCLGLENYFGFEELSRLFYDKELIDNYISSIRNIKSNFIESKASKGIKKPELLWNVLDTTSEIVKNIMSGASINEAKEDFVVHKKF